MANAENMTVDSPIGRHKTDATGSAIGVVRMSADKSYTGVGELLQRYINEADQNAWDEIKSKIDYTYEHLDFALNPLADRTDLRQEIKARLDKGQKLLFKPNIVGVQNIDPQTHGPTPTSSSCTEWPFIAALMRWFHDKLAIRYHQMSLGEAATAMPAVAGRYTLMQPQGQPVTTEATLEGKSGNFFGGWGFYFVRKYLSETHGVDADDNPMNGYEESVSGVYLPPGHVSDKLMIYDLNRIFDSPDKGREIPVPEGINYKTITLHKAIIGGDPSNPKDMEAYPGCILVNVPKFKVHAIALFTNIIKNLGIGLYPMQYAKTGDRKWDYSVPHFAVPGMKGGIPHEVWVAELDPDTCLPKKDGNDQYRVNKTGGITATMIDIIKAVSHQNTYMVHIVDGIEAINRDHTGSGMGVRCLEGMVFAGLDPVATDLLCARYMFSNVPIEEAFRVKLDDGTGGYFPQSVPLPNVVDKNIITGQGYDCPLSRDTCFQKAEERGLGIRDYYVIGHDVVSDLPLASLKGHLGKIQDGKFTDLITTNLFYAIQKFPWDMQQTVFGYMSAMDELSGSTTKKAFLQAFDEDNDGRITYEEFGKKGMWSSILHISGKNVSRMSEEKYGYLKNNFSNAFIFRHGNPLMNPDGHDVYRDFILGNIILTAYQMSQMDIEGPDPFFPGLTWGKGKWPSMQMARFIQTGIALYGMGFPNTVAFPSLYSTAFFYADHTQNDSRYTGEIISQPNPEALNRYFSDVSNDKRKPLDFLFHVPEGYDNLSGKTIPNVKATADPHLIFTASFSDGKEVWP